MDVLLTAIVGFTQLVLGGMGVYVSLKPPEPRYHWHWIAGFMGVGLLGVVLTGWSAQRASNAQEKATGKITEAVTAATNANTAATNANNAAITAEHETEAASAEARAANNSLARQINQRSEETNATIVKVGTDTESSIKAIAMGTPPRRIPPEKRAELIHFFSEKPAKVEISAIANDGEAYRFAQDWYEIFKASGWIIEGDRISVFISGGQPQFGVVVKLHGEPVSANETFQVPNSEPSGYIARAMSALKIAVVGQRYPDLAEELVGLEFYARPPAQ